MVQVNKGRIRDRGRGLSAEALPCHGIYGPCETARIDVTPEDRVEAGRIGRMSQICFGSQGKIERQSRVLCSSVISEAQALFLQTHQ